ncbi:hypothetical protein TWF694_003883 [Orbilia ellipsospora]|uniref:Uncharacterized protein n=1 Tax=Orbilia ellipsospora TaxID=2528407 RepID=A0AAV9X0W0_9PEZI
MPPDQGPPSDSSSDLKTHGDYTVGWICALSKELTAATAMLEPNIRLFRSRTMTPTHTSWDPLVDTTSS